MGQQLSWLEHTTDNREVDGSSPFWPTTISYGGLAQLGERLPCKQEVTGSIPVLSTTFKLKVESGKLKVKKLTEVSWKQGISLSFLAMRNSIVEKEAERAMEETKSNGART